MADYYTHFSVAVQLQGKLAAAWVTDTLRSRRNRWEELTDTDDDDAADEVAIDFEFTVEDGCLYLSDDGGTGNVEHVARFLQEMMMLEYVQESVSLQWAETCSRPRPDSFTGGGVLVTRTKLYWFVVPELIEKKMEALERRRCRG